MGAHATEHVDLEQRFSVPGAIRTVFAALAVIGLGIFAYGVTAEPWRAWSNWLLSSYYWVGIALGAVVMIAILNVVNSGWSAVVRRVPEALMTYLPIGAVTMLVVALGPALHELYEWSHEDIVAGDHLLQHKEALLNPGGFITRMCIYFALWIGLGFLIRSNSLKQDSDPSLKYTSRNVALSAIFIIVYGLSITMAALDWMMSLEPHWFSTMFGVYNFIGMFVAAISTTTLVVVLVKSTGAGTAINENHLHDLGKMMFAFATFWAYIWISQFLLIWYSNIPEETFYYINRQHDGWQFLWFINVLVNWAIPFVTLMPRPNKRNPKVLVPVAILLLCGHWLDLYLQVIPATSHFAAHHHGADVHGPIFGLHEIGAFIGLGGVFGLVTLTMLSKTPLVPKNDPYLEESLAHHQ